MTSPTTKVLLLGGHGKISLLLTALLLAKSWHVTSVIRNPEHANEILSLAASATATTTSGSSGGGGGGGKLDVLVDSLDDIKSDDDARRVVEKVRPEIVVWSAGSSCSSSSSSSSLLLFCPFPPPLRFQFSDTSSRSGRKRWSLTYILHRS